MLLPSLLLVKAYSLLFWFVMASICFFLTLQLFLFFFKCFTKRGICTLFLLYYSTLITRNKFISILPDDNADVFAVSLLISNCSFLPLVLSLIVKINLYIASKRFFLKREWLSDARVLPITKKEYGFAVHFW